LKKRVFWTAEEKQSLIKHAINILDKNPGVTQLEALRRAQKAELPPERQRKIQAVTLEKWYADAVGRTSREAHRAAIQTTKIEMVKEVVIVPIGLADMPLEDIIGELLRRILFSTGVDHKIRGMFVAPLIQAVRQELPSLARLILSERKQIKVSTTKSEIQKVLVIGLLPEQENEIIKEFDGVISLSFFKSGNMDSLRAMSASVDRVILMRRFTSHSIQDVAKAVAGKRFMVCDGATSGLKALLEHLYLDEEK
jgi:hypothetical protein